MTSRVSVPEQMVEWFGPQHQFSISWHALQWLGISRFVELMDPSKEYMDIQQGQSNAFMGCFAQIREWAKNEKYKQGADDWQRLPIWEVFRALRPDHLEMEKKIRYARRFWSRLLRIQCMSMKALKVFEITGIPDDYQDTTSFIRFLFSDKMPSLLSRIRNNMNFDECKSVYRDLHLFDVVLVMDLMLMNRVHIPIRQPDQGFRRE